LARPIAISFPIPDVLPVIRQVLPSIISHCNRF
jgi:hypothetical protein